MYVENNRILLVLLYKSIACVIYLYYLCINERGIIMVNERKYKIGCAGSGWGVWDNAGKKIKGFTGRPVGRFMALKYMYELYGWDWSKSKYVKSEPYLANI